ncbi:MAG: hypothetical protein IJS93_00470 [Clostridia bacterium]|nr:hypothetical protein [Clostridia bacterium]
MENLLAISSNSIVHLVLFGIIVALLLAVIISYALWKKGKLNAKGNFFYKLDGAISQLVPMWKAKFITNSNAKEKVLFWLVTIFGLIDASLTLVSSILVHEFSISFMFSLLFVLLIVLLIVTDYKLTPKYPYYYDYNPSLLMYAVISLVFGFVNFVQAVSVWYWLSFLLGFLSFAGVILLYGMIVLRRFFKREFKPLDLLVYIGGAVLSALEAVYFALYGVHGSIFGIIASAVSFVYAVLVIAIILYVYDKYEFAKKLFKK